MNSPAVWDYEIKRFGCPAVDPIRVKNNTYVDRRNVVVGSTYIYEVTAINPLDPSNATRSSSFSLQPVQAVVMDPPDPPKGLVASIDESIPAIRLSWVDDERGGDITDVYVLRSDGVWFNLTAANLVGHPGQFDDTSVLRGMPYSYTVWSRNSYGLSLPATTARLTSVPSTPTDANVAGPVAGTIVSIAAIAVSIAFMLWYRRRTARRKQEAMARSEMELIDAVARRPEIVALELPNSRICLRHKLGEGEFGEVYCADVVLAEGSTAVVAAIKTFKLPPTQSPDEIRSARVAFMAEIDLMRGVPSHINVIGLLGVCTRSEPNCVVLEFAEHGDLRHYLHGGKATFTLADFACFCADIARGMAHLAECGIVHRDLAARNCMVIAGPRLPNAAEAAWSLSSRGNVTVKIADFGLSRDASAGDYYRAKTRAKLPIKWMAPEALDRRVYTHASDVWSYGITMWEIYSRGCKPYPGLENYAVPDFLRTGKRMAAPDGCPPNVYAIMESCWRKLPETRPTFVQLVTRMTRTIAGGKVGPAQAAYTDRDQRDYAEVVPDAPYISTIVNPVYHVVEVADTADAAA